MNKLLFLSLIVVAPFALAEEVPNVTGADPAAQCRQYAVDEGIAAEDLDAFIHNCIREMTTSDEG